MYDHMKTALTNTIAATQLQSLAKAVNASLEKLEEYYAKARDCQYNRITTSTFAVFTVSARLIPSSLRITFGLQFAIQHFTAIGLGSLHQEKPPKVPDKYLGSTKLPKLTCPVPRLLINRLVKINHSRK